MIHFFVYNTGKKQTKVFCMWETLYQRFGASGNLV